MRRISRFTTLGALIATFGVQPMSATAAKAPHASHHAAHAKAAKHKHAAQHRKTGKRVHVTAESRQLRRLVASHAQCMTSVDPTSLRLLTLRSGLDGKKRGQKATAHVLKVSRQREQLLEQIALLELRGQTGGSCSVRTTSNTLGPAARLTATAPWLNRGSV
jgi:hypothetical protein